MRREAEIYMSVFAKMALARKRFLDEIGNPNRSMLSLASLAF